MVIVLLPGMDGTGVLFRPIVEQLPEGLEARIVSYPEDTYFTYQELAKRVADVLLRFEPYVIVAESYSGPIASLVAAHPVGDLRAVVFVSSFASLPCGRMGSWVVKILPAALFPVPAPGWILRWLLMDAASAPQLVAEAHNAIARVRPEVLACRLRDALSADFAPLLQNCSVRIVCVFPHSDRLLGTRALRRFLAARPDIERVSVPGPHFLLQCAPDSVIVALRKIGLFVDA